MTVSQLRQRVVQQIAARVLGYARLGEPGPRVAIDGVDGAGKSTFAGELASALRSSGAGVVQLCADDFLRPRSERYRRGRRSREGFWLDSYDYPALIESLDGFGPGGTGRYREGVLDEATDGRLSLPWRPVPHGCVLVVDGLFLHRDELVDRWDLSIWLHAPFEVSVARLATRDGSDPDPEHPANSRYVGGQRLYFAACSPWDRAAVVIDNTDLASPRIRPAGPVARPAAARSIG